MTETMLRERAAQCAPRVIGPSGRSAGPEPKVAIIHYWLVRMRGGERVVERLIHLFPNADIFTHVLDPSGISEALKSRPIKTTFISRMPGAKTHYQKYLPLMPMALEELDLSGYDLVISSESGPAKGVITQPQSLHVCYCHSPMRYLWDAYGEYKASAGVLSRLVMPWAFHHLRSWDVTNSARVDGFVANSNFIRSRIEKYYRRESDVVFPPVPVHQFEPTTDVEPFYLWVGQMTPYKRADIAVEAFNRLGLPLVMVGDGPMGAAVRKAAKANITVHDRVDYAELRRLYAHCRALVFTPEEDFGIVPVEAMAAGRPVLAYGRGGALDSIMPDVSGVFFDEQTVEDVIDGVERIEAWLSDFNPADAIRNAARFSYEAFDQGFLDAVDRIADGRYPKIAAMTRAARQR